MFIGKSAVVYNSVPALTLGSTAGVMDSRMNEWSTSVLDFVLEVLPVADGLEMHMVVRNDIYDAGLADQLGRHFTDIISNGPERLEIETAH